MNSESKTTEDILREMREYADQLDNDGDITGADFRDFANQLEEAMKREKVEAVTLAAGQAVNLTDEKWRRDTGNTAAMRAALEDIRDYARQISDKTGEADVASDADSIADICDAALSAPPRNCDRAKDEAEVAWGIEHGRPWNNEEDELATWLFAPMSGEKEGGAK